MIFPQATIQVGNMVKIQKSSRCNAQTQSYHSLFKAELHFGLDNKREHNFVTLNEVNATRSGLEMIQYSMEKKLYLTDEVGASYVIGAFLSHVLSYLWS